MSTAKRIEFGDFQTPPSLARKVCLRLQKVQIRPATIIEPTCGVGNFLFAALASFPEARSALAADIEPRHLDQVRERLKSGFGNRRVELQQADFFMTDWRRTFNRFAEPLLVIGNPPWINNARQGTLGTSNLPVKQNTGGLRGIEAITGKSNFDISEWMILELLEALAGRHAVLAMLCKTDVARKALRYAWQRELPLDGAAIHRFDTAATFDVSVDACLLMCRLDRRNPKLQCPVYSSLDCDLPAQTIGYEQARLIADVAAYRRWRSLLAPSSCRRWRSGIKHDCAKVMELQREGQYYRNGLGELVELEGEYLYPMLKSSQLVRGTTRPQRWMLVTQQTIGERTETIRQRAPKTWRYLQSHAERLDRRASAIYRNRPHFSVFGVGPYAFAPWKVAISGLYKQLRFVEIGSFEEKPVVLDDTCCLLACRSRQEANRMARLLNGPVAREFFSGYLFWDRKRPITIEALSLLDLDKLAEHTRCQVQAER